jgi:serine/threonine protein kinase
MSSDHSHATLENLSNRFQAAWREGHSVQMEVFLAQVSEPLRVPLLLRLIPIDLDNRWRRGEKIFLETYAARFPELGPANALPPELLWPEFRARDQADDKPHLENYRQRFPVSFPDMERQLKEQTGERRFDTLQDTPSLLPGFPPSNDRPPAPATNPPPQAGPRLTEPIISLPEPPVGSGRGSSRRDGSGPLGPGERREPKSSNHGEGYRILEKIGAGAFGEVFRAEAPGGFEVAIKVSTRSIDSPATQEDLKAVQMLRKIAHPFLLQMHAAWVQNDMLHIAMELADGTMAQRLQKHLDRGDKGVPRAELLDYMEEAANALDFLHGKGILHRDIKPQNLLYSAGHAKVGDFGMAYQMSIDQSMATMKELGGTLAFMAPEAFQNKAGKRSDQFALAMSYAQLRLGRHPLGKQSYAELITLHLNSPAEWKLTLREALHGLPEAEMKVLLKALARNSSDRFNNCVEFVKALRGASAPPPDPPQPSRSPPLLLGVVLVGSLGLLVWLVLAAIFVPPTPPPKPPPPPVIYLPPGCEKADGAVETEVDGKTYWNRIIHKRADPPAVFLLIPQKKNEDPRTFYMMENKVSRSQFHNAMTKEADLQKLVKSFKDKWGWTIQEKWRKQSLIGEEAQWPVFDITVTEAYCFAAWLEGNLPTVDQWDKAGGGYDGEPGPYQAGADKAQLQKELGLHRENPLPIDRLAPLAISLFGCRDMAGNGREFTRDLYDLNATIKHRVPRDPPEKTKEVVLRAQSHNKGNRPPYTFGKTLRDFLGYEETDNDVGFRVVLEIRSGP